MNSLPSAYQGLVVARGQGVAMRLKHLDDAPADYRWNCDAEIARLNHREVSEETYPQYVTRLENDLSFLNPRERTFALEDGNGNHIGNVMYYNVAAAGDRAEIGITIGAEQHRKRGLGREAVVLFLRYLFETTSFRAITLHTLASNEPALRCFRACGFEAIGHLEQRGARLVGMAVRREYWLLHDGRGRFLFKEPSEQRRSRG